MQKSFKKKTIDNFILHLLSAVVFLSVGTRHTYDVPFTLSFNSRTIEVHDTRWQHFPFAYFFRFGSAVVVHHRDDNFSISATARTVQSRTEVAIYLLKFSASQNVFLFDLPAVGFRHPLLHYCILHCIDMCAKNVQHCG